MLPQRIAPDVCDLSFRGVGNDFGIGLKLFDAQQPVMCRRLVLGRNTQPAVVCIEVLSHGPNSLHVVPCEPRLAADGCGSAVANGNRQAAHSRFKGLFFPVRLQSFRFGNRGFHARRVKARRQARAPQNLQGRISPQPRCF